MDMCEVGVKFHGFRIDGFHFHPPDPKNSVLQRVIREKLFFLHILITRSPILIPFIRITFYRFIGGLSHVLMAIRFTAYVLIPQTQKTHFHKE